MNRLSFNDIDAQGGRPCGALRRAKLDAKTAPGSQMMCFLACFAGVMCPVSIFGSFWRCGAECKVSESTTPANQNQGSVFLSIGVVRRGACTLFFIRKPLQKLPDMGPRSSRGPYWGPKPGRKWRQNVWKCARGAPPHSFFYDLH